MDVDLHPYDAREEVQIVYKIVKIKQLLKPHELASNYIPETFATASSKIPGFFLTKL